VLLQATLLLGVAAWLAGCASTSESAGADTKLTGHVGDYSPAPRDVPRPRVGVPPFKVTTAAGFGGGGSDLNDLAADQITTLLYKTGRFDVIERTQLKKLLDEQNMEGIVKPGEMAKAGQIRGVDYLLIGKVTNLRVKRADTRKGANLAGVGGAFSTFGFDQKDTAITTDCGVDIRLVDPTSGKVMVAENSEYSRTDSASGMGVSILGGHAESDANVRMSEDDKGKILRLALDDAVRKALPAIDAFVRDRAPRSTPAAPLSRDQRAPSVPVPAAVAPASENGAVAAKKFCPDCGTGNAVDSKFCAKCGHKLN
jgi:curli biogenesis system outer membrane secretion channel CsgG